jgi:hypothetical protein
MRDYCWLRIVENTRIEIEGRNVHISTPKLAVAEMVIDYGCLRNFLLDKAKITTDRFANEIETT